MTEFGERQDLPCAPTQRSCGGLLIGDRRENPKQCRAGLSYERVKFGDFLST